MRIPDGPYDELELTSTEGTGDDSVINAESPEVAGSRATIDALRFNTRVKLQTPDTRGYISTDATSVPDMRGGVVADIAGVLDVSGRSPRTYYRTEFAGGEPPYVFEGEQAVEEETPISWLS
ncbi:MAG: hypothetical protein AAB592_04810 [Patescibacteria group bacterium]